MIIKFPELSITQKVGNRTKKNLIQHLVVPEQEIELGILSNDRTSIKAKDKNNKKYLLISRETDSYDDYEYVALVQKFTRASISGSNIMPVKWLKHPDIKGYTTEEITDSWTDNFNFKKEDQTKDILGLRTPQIGAIHALMGHLTNSKEIATVVLPTGTGKTETMLSVLVANQCNKLLVTVPSDSLRSQLAKKFRSLGLLVVEDINKNTILNREAKYPKVGVINTGFNTEGELVEFFNKCNVIVSTMNLVSSAPVEQQRKIAELCSHLFIDEAHHSKAGNWDNFIKKFDKNKVVQFTATPYRNDGQLLDGKIIYNFTLKEAQEQGYFKTIDFLPVRVYEDDKADIEIAKKAVERLRQDISEGKDHILMARCGTKERAEYVSKIYEEHYSNLNPVVIHSGVRGKNEIKQRIINKEHKIIVCVDMLGEGFDLPELKVAAFHDVRKSLPITLQFAGRFTRTSRDANLGNASFVANLYQPNLNDELALLYVRESNWNSILPELSQKATQEQVELQDFLSGFENTEDATIPYQDIRPAFSAVAYLNRTDNWFPMNFSKGIKGYNNYDYKFYDINRNKQTLIILLGKKKAVDWGKFKDVYNIEWNIFIVYWETKKNILFIHSSEKSGEYRELANAIIGEDATLIKDEKVFKSFHNLNRIKLYNLGLRKGLGRDISFQSYYGRGVQDGLSQSEERSGLKNNSFGVGFENGEVTSLGCSRKGRIWSYSRGTIDQFIVWCNKISMKLSNPNIDPDEIFLKNTIKPKKLSVRPNVMPIVVDWSPKLFNESKVSLAINGKNYDLSNTELNVKNPTLDKELQFSLDTIDGESILFTQKLSVKTINAEEVFDYKIENVSNINALIKQGNQAAENIEEYFEKYPPIFWFADGSNLTGYEYIQYDEDFLPFSKEEIIVWDWTGVSINKESEKFGTLVTTSIQHHFFKKLLAEDYDIVFNDDEPGEMADIVAIKNLDESVEVELYHLKYAIEGKVSNQIKNFYEVCGQAQKSLRWKYRDESTFVNHLIRREIKKQKKSQTRIKKGSIEELESLLSQIKKTKPVNYQIYIVQPALSKENASDDILHQLGVTANHIKKEGNINLKVIGSK